MPLDLSPEERAAVIALIKHAPLEPDDLVAAIRASMRVRQDNSANGSLVINALHRVQSWRAISAATDIPVSTLRDWAKAPPAGDDEDDDQ